MHPYLAQAALKQYCEVCEGENVVSPCPETDPSFDLSRQARDEQHKEGKESTHQKRGEQTFVFLQGSGIRVMAYSPLGSSADRYPVRTLILGALSDKSIAVAPLSNLPLVPTPSIC